MAVKKNKNGVWYFKVYVTDEFGKKKQIKRENKDWTRNDARLAEAKVVQDSTMDSTMLLCKLSEIYFKHKETSLKSSSIRSLKSKYNFMVDPYFGKIRIDQINNKMIMAWHRQLLEKGYSNSSLEIGQGIFKAMLEHAVKCNLLLKNPYTIDHIKNNTEVKHEVETVSINDFNKFLGVIENQEYYNLYVVLYWVGLRIGEALGLKFGDVDFENNNIRISSTYNQIERRSTTPKTKSSYRVIKMNTVVREALEKQRNKYSRAWGYSDEMYVFGFDKPIPYSTLKHWHSKYIVESGLPYFKIHSLRHSCVSVLISLGVKPLQIAKRMGHSVNMVNTVYGHLFPDDDQLIADKQDNLQCKINDIRNNVKN